MNTAIPKGPVAVEDPACEAARESVMNTGQAAVLDYYATHDRDDAYEKAWGYANPVAAAYWHERDLLVFPRLRSRLGAALHVRRVLEVGVGHGHELAKFARLGIPEEGLTGIDIVPDRLVRARLNYPGMNFSRQNAAELAFDADSFDVVFQFTCVMHAPSRDAQERICAEMVRVTKPGGVIIWWDLTPVTWRVLVARRVMGLLCGPRSLRRGAATLAQILAEVVSADRRRQACRAALPTYVRPVSRRDLPEFFPGMNVRAMRAGLDYGLWETLWPRSCGLARMLWRTGWLYQHCFAVIEKLE